MLEDKIAAAKAARKAVGFASMGVTPSSVNSNNVLLKLERNFGKDDLSVTREFLREIAANPVLPSEKSCVAAMTEIRESLKALALQETQEMIDDIHQEQSEAPGQ